MNAAANKDDLRDVQYMGEFRPLSSFRARLGVLLLAEGFGVLLLLAGEGLGVVLFAGADLAYSSSWQEQVLAY